jgi:outer membrane protein W
MKKTLLIIAVTVIGLTTNLKAQDNCIEKGKFIVDAFYGYPYVAGEWVKSTYNSTTNNTNIESVRNLNHIGGKFEYMISDNIGIGLEYTYASVKAKYKEENTTVNGFGSSVTTINHYTVQLYKQRILGRINFHFATTKQVDPYATIGFGYKVSLLKSNNPNDAESISAFNKNFSNLLPVAIRFGVGLRYFITPNFGLNVEAGIGGPSVQGGVTVKF